MAGMALLAPVAVARELEVSAGMWDRDFSLVEVGEPASGMPERPVLRAESGRMMPLQELPGGGWGFLLPELAAGETLRLRLESAPAEPAAAVSAEPAGEEGGLSFQAGDRPFARYIGTFSGFPEDGIAEVFARGGYLHPLFTPGGRRVTGDYPSDHRHHHGIWTAWTRVRVDGRDTDFWNMGQGRGLVEFAGLDRHWSGPVHGGLVSRHQAVDLSSGERVVAMHERWTLALHRADSLDQARHVLDLRIEQVVAEGVALELPAYHYGGLGVRGHEGWTRGDIAFLGSSGSDNREQLNTQPTRWIRMGGTVDEGRASLIVLNHPANFRAPQPVRVNPDIPFLSVAPQIAGDMALDNGQPYVSRYRILAVDGEPDAAEIERLWRDYAEPAMAAWVD